MLIWTLKHIILSVLFIWIIHKIYQYFQSQLTVPKVKDLVNKPLYEYNKMFKSMEEDIEEDNYSRHGKSLQMNNSVDLQKKNEMKYELKKYLAEVTNRPEIPTSNDSMKFAQNLSFDSFVKKNGDDSSMHAGYNLETPSQGKNDFNYNSYSFSGEDLSRSDF